MKKFLKYKAIIFLLAFSSFSSCIKNDIPYPEEALYINSIVGDGILSSTSDYKNQTVELVLDETVDVENVNITSVDYTDGADFSVPLLGVQNFSSSITTVLTKYQSYEWIVSATQDIERYFKVEGQIGVEEIDTTNRTATAYISEGSDLTDITITALKLGPADITTMSPSIDKLTSFSAARYVSLSYNNVDNELWTLMVKTTDVNVILTLCDVRARSVNLIASGDVSLDYGFRYRATGATDWIEVSQDNITLFEGQFSTTIEGLDDQSSYQVVAYCGSDETAIEDIVTEEAIALENGDFELWSKPSNTWYPFLEDGEKYWATGNPGSTTLGSSYNLTTPNSDDIRPGSTGIYSANLASQNVLVKFAAASLFVGNYVKTAGTNGIIGVGQPFNSRPKALKGWLKYDCGIIDIVGTTPSGVTIESGVTPDQGFIYIALGTWTPEEYGISSRETEMLGTADTPIIFDTRDITTFFNSTSKDVVAYGELAITESVEQWQEFTIELDYNSLTTIPTHLVIVCSSSRYGDYFTGSSQSVMVLDDFELVY
ncbi:MAG: PCMD domain-containing protein [Rikenellaceae bacterium]